MLFMFPVFICLAVVDGYEAKKSVYLTDRVHMKSAIGNAPFYVYSAYLGKSLRKTQVYVNNNKAYHLCTHLEVDAKYNSNIYQQHAEWSEREARIKNLFIGE